MMKKILGVDFDDVLFQCDAALLEYHVARGGEPYSLAERNTFTLEPVWNCSAEEVQRRLDEFSETVFHKNAAIVSGAHDALATLNKTYEIIIVTGRADSARTPTLEWLEKNLLGLYREIHFANHVYGDPARRRQKSDILKEFGVTAFIEDAPHFAAEVAGAGIPVFLLDTPWNRAETPQGATRVYSWEEIVDRLV
jgi:uncharacterized HAD superfamily protein